MIGNNLSPADVVIAQFLPAPAGAAAPSTATRQKVERLTGTMTMFAQLDNGQKSCPPVVSMTGQIVLDAVSKIDAARAYNKALVATMEAMAKPEATHYLGRAASIPGEGGFEKFMASYFVHYYYCGISL